MLAGARHPMQCLEKKKCCGFSIRTLRWASVTNVPEFLEVEHSCVRTQKSGQPLRTESQRARSTSGTESPAQPSPGVTLQSHSLLGLQRAVKKVGAWHPDIGTIVCCFSVQVSCGTS